MQTQKGFICAKTRYYRLEKYLQQKGFTKGSTKNSLYTKFEGDKLLIIVVYVDDIIFSSNENL